jgi:transmembrane sensor
MNISATGTRFNVLNCENENRIEKTLENGIIHVTISGQKPFDLKIGQQVVYFTNTNNVVVLAVDAKIYTSWKENILCLINNPIEEAVRKIGRRNNVPFEIQDSDILYLNYTATLVDESVEEVMEMLKTVSPITYKFMT